MALRYYISSEEAPFFINNKMGYSDRIPTSGSYKVGDFIISSTQANGIFGWVCTVAGTPGTWIEIGSGNSGGSSTTPIELVGLSNTVEFDDARSSVDIGIPEFNKESDILEVHYNGLLLAEGIHYSLNYNGTAIENIEGQWNASGYPDQQMFFKVIKVKNAGNGSLVQLRNTVDVGGNVFEVNTGISDYAYRSDIMEVHLNGVLLIEGIDYNYSNGKIVKIDKSEGWNPHSVEGQKMFFRVLKNLGDTTGIVTKTISVSSSTTISSPASEVEIGIVEYNKDTDTLMAYVNSTFMVEGVDYEINSTGSKIVSKNGNWNEEGIDGYTFAFVVLKEIEVNMNGSVGGTLDPVVMDKINTIGDVSLLETENKVDLVSAVNEVLGKANKAFQNVSNGKELIANAITDKGVETLATGTFAEMANNINSISTMKDVLVDGLPIGKEFELINEGEKWMNTTIQNSLPYNFYGGSAVVYNNEIHILGGASGITKHYKYNGSSWVSVSTLPYDFYYGSAVIYNNEIHILGSNNSGNYTKHYKFNGTTWTQVSTLPYNFSIGSAVLFNNEIHILGSSGSSSYTKHYKYNGTSWTQVSTLPDYFYSGSAVVFNNEIHILGGANISSYTKHYKYNGSSWVSVSTLPYDFYYGSAVIYNNEIHILGGISGQNNYYKYDGSSWTQVSTLPYNFYQGSAVIFNNEIHILGSSDSSSYTKHYKSHKIYIINIK